MDNTNRYARGPLTRPIVPIQLMLGLNLFIRNNSHLSQGQLSMSERPDSGTEIRRILLLTRLRKNPRGLTMNQLVNDCKRIPGWNNATATPWEILRQVLQTLINDQLVSVKSRFLLTVKGREYLADPLQWKLNVETKEEAEQRLFWDNIHGIFDRARARLRSKSESASG